MSTLTNWLVITHFSRDRATGANLSTQGWSRSHRYSGYPPNQGRRRHPRLGRDGHRFLREPGLPGASGKARKRRRGQLARRTSHQDHLREGVYSQRGHQLELYGGQKAEGLYGKLPSLYLVFLILRFYTTNACSFIAISSSKSHISSTRTVSRIRGLHMLVFKNCD